MTTPVFVLHGIGNRDPGEFAKTVDDLGRAVGGVDPHPVYWGDLGADYRWIAETIPGAAPSEIRDGEVEPNADPESFTEFLLGRPQPPPGDEIRDGSTVPAAVPAIVLVAATAALGAGSTEIRDEPEQAEDVRQALADGWPATRWLRLVDDQEVLRAIGAAVAGPIADGIAIPDGQGAEVRGIRSGVRGFVSKRLQELDRVVGAVVGAAGGRLNTHLRTSFLPGITRGVGDILVYQRHRAEISDRVRSEIAKVDPALGRSPQHPVDVLAHSLGGVIAIDMATSEDPLFIRRLVTFGSQAPFFHVCDPRGGLLARYTGDGAVALPATVGSWTNLWEPLDPVAFVAARVFSLHDGSAPLDMKVSHLASSGIWTHSDYWTLTSVATAIRAVLEKRT